MWIKLDLVKLNVKGTEYSPCLLILVAGRFLPPPLRPADLIVGTAVLNQDIVQVDHPGHVDLVSGVRVPGELAEPASKRQLLLLVAAGMSPVWRTFCALKVIF